MSLQSWKGSSPPGHHQNNRSPEKRSRAKVDYGNITNWELKTVLDDFANKATFYGPGGETMSAAEVRAFVGY